MTLIGRVELAVLPSTPVRVLLIDDEVGNLHGIRRVLESDHHVVEIADRGEAGLEQCLGDFGPDVVLCDLMLPDLLGPEVYAQAIAKRPELEPRFLFMTGGVLDASSARFLETFRERILWKPFSVRAMNERLRRMGPRPYRASSGRLLVARRTPSR